MAVVTTTSTQENDFITSNNYVMEDSFNLVSGNAVFVLVRWQTTGSTVTSVTDTAGNTYAAIPGTLSDDGGGERHIQWWMCDVTTAGNAANFLTANFSDSGTFFKAMAAVQYSGTTASPVDDVAIGASASSSGVDSATFDTTQNDTYILVGVTQNNMWTDTWTWVPTDYVTLTQSDPTDHNTVTSDRTAITTLTGASVQGNTASANSKLISVVALKLGATATSTITGISTWTGASTITF